MEMNNLLWLKNIPQNWNVARIGSLYTLRNEKVSDEDYPPLSVTKQGIVPQLKSVAKSDAHDSRKMVKAGDFVINSRSDRRGSCGISKYDGSVSLINTVLSPRHNMHAGYYDWLFHTVAFADEFYRNGHGIVDDLWTTGWDEMKHILVPVPALKEQEAISAFLNMQCAKIDGLIEQAKTIIEEYKTWKQSIIYKAVTKGTNSNIAMKDSGTEFGFIPGHWTIIRLKNIATSIYKGSGITKDDTAADGKIPCVRYGELYSKYNYYFDTCLTSTDDDKVPTKRYFAQGDILFAGTGESVEEIGKNVAYLGNDSCLAGGDIIILTHEQNPVFLSFALNSYYGQIQKGRGKAKLKVVHISATDIGNIVIFLPPLEEQNAIADYLRDRITAIDEVIFLKQELIVELEAYKRSLIYEVVTGKRKVV